MIEAQTIHDIENLCLALLLEIRLSALQAEENGFNNGISINYSPVAANCIFNGRTNQYTPNEFPANGIIAWPNPDPSKFACFLTALSYVYDSLIHDTHLTKRDFYYLDVPLFMNQTNSDQSLDQISGVLQKSRQSLHITAAPRGMLIGPLTVEVERHAISCAQGIPVCSEAINPKCSLKTGLRFVLVVEKESVFARLAACGFAEEHGCALITGKGFPCLATRMVLYRLRKSFPDIPFVCLTDADVYGIQIYWTYRFGSVRSCIERNVAVPSLRYLGLNLSDLRKLDLLDRCGIAISRKDLNRASSMLHQPYAKLCRKVRKKLEDHDQAARLCRN